VSKGSDGKRRLRARTANPGRVQGLLQLEKKELWKNKSSRRENREKGGKRRKNMGRMSPRHKSKASRVHTEGKSKGPSNLEKFRNEKKKKVVQGKKKGAHTIRQVKREIVTSISHAERTENLKEQRERGNH